MTDHKEWEREMSTEFNAMMDGIRSEPTPEDSLRRSLLAAESIGMTRTAYQRGIKNAAIVATIMYAFVGVVSLVVSKWFELNLTLVVGGVFIAIFAISFLSALASCVIGRAFAGRVLLDCGPHPSRKRFLGVGLVFGLGAIVELAVSTELTAVCFGIFLLGFALFWLFAAKGRLQICENGVFQYWSLLRWNRIQSYSWKGTTDATLLLQTKSRLPFPGRGALPVAIEQKAAVDELLQEHVQ